MTGPRGPPTAIPKSSASYILRALERRGYLRRDAESGRYQLGLKILSLGRDVQATLDIADIAQPFMCALVERVHLTSHLALLDQGEAVYVEKVDAPGFFKVNTWVGRRMFVHSTSVGKVLLAWRPKEEVEEILRAQGLKKRTPKTITGITRLMAELETVRRNGYAVDDEENSLGARWDIETGEPLYNSIVWTDTRTAAIVRELKSRPGADELTPLCGLPLSTYPSSTKLLWLLRNVEAVKEATRRISRQLVRTGAAGPA